MYGPQAPQLLNHLVENAQSTKPNRWKFGKPTITAKKPFSVNHLHGNMRQSAGIDPGAGTVDNLV
jgi:hypothetical protein